MKQYTVAVVGATGAVGTEIIRTLLERNFPLRELRLLASKRSTGKSITVNEQQYQVKEATPESFEGVDIALFSAGGSISAQLAPEAVKRGALVIDNTSHFRMDEAVPLVVPEVNPEDIFTHQGIIANPNCSTIQMVVALQAIRAAYGLKKVIVSTYQAVSGTGQSAISELDMQMNNSVNGELIEASVYPYQILGNVIPQIDVFEENGFTKEEMKMINETKKIFHDDTIEVTATCVRVPVKRGHSESIYMETKEPFEMEEIYRLLREAAGVVVQDNPSGKLYPMPLFAEGKGLTFIGRIRKDLHTEKALNVWVVSDNLLKGAALNAVQIAETYIAKNNG